MELTKEIYQNPDEARQALRVLSPFMVAYWTLIVIVAGVIGFGLWRLFSAQRRLTRPPAAPASLSSKDGKLTGSNYVGLSKEEMKLLLEAELKRRAEAGETVVLKKPFEGPLDWADVDETGAPRPQAERGPSYDEWQRSQGTGPASGA